MAGPGFRPPRGAPATEWWGESARYGGRRRRSPASVPGQTLLLFRPRCWDGLWRRPSSRNRPARLLTGPTGHPGHAERSGRQSESPRFPTGLSPLAATYSQTVTSQVPSAKDLASVFEWERAFLLGMATGKLPNSHNSNGSPLGCARKKEIVWSSRTAGQYGSTTRVTALPPPPINLVIYQGPSGLRPGHLLKLASA